MRSLFTRSHSVPFTAGDWLVTAGICILLAIGVFWLFSEVSNRFTVEVPARGGTYSEALVGTPRFINPILALSDVDRDMVALVYSGLMRGTPDGGIATDLAASYTISDDQRTYTFTIRDDAHFHDGQPVTADDVAFSITLAQNPALKSPKRANWEGVIVDVVDPHTISFTLKEPYAPFLENTRLGILPKHLWNDVKVEEVPFSKLNIEPVGAGPYSVEKLVTSSGGIPTAMSLTAFSDGVRVPYITHMNISFFTDTESLTSALEGDPLLAAHSVSPNTLTNHTTHEAVLGRVFAVFFNQNQNDLFANKAVRTALDQSLDKNAIIATLIGGYGTALAGPLPPEVTSTVAPESTERDFIAEARATLVSDGWVLNESGVFEKTVKKVTRRLAFTLTTGTAPELKGAAELVAERWRALGADVTTQFQDAADLQQDSIRPRKYDALLFGEVIGREMDLFAFWDSSQRNDPGLNIALYTNATVDKLLKEARTNPDIDARHEAARNAATIIGDEVAAVFLYSPHFAYVTQKKLLGLTLGTIVTPSDRFLSVSDWYLETERVWPFFK
jgi:peptide/nickel transport system substrate-binding protein